ncbi:MAG TPA: hypothetical protein VFW19_13405 [Allosphingosinicella sp.]|nr:hypothetical protein [Allosphingosinicella sp.]
MFERWRKWTYKRFERRVSATDDFAEFEQWASGPWTPEMATKMPWDVLVKGPQLGTIDAETRRVIDLEISRRFRSRQPIIANIISVAALAVALLK